MKLYELADMEIEDGLMWNDYEKHLYCDYCQRVDRVFAKGKNSSSICQECGKEMVEITDEMIEKSKTIGAGGCLRFTPEERKEMWADWKKNVEMIPTWDTFRKRQERAKKPHQTFVTANI